MESPRGARGIGIYATGTEASARRRTISDQSFGYAFITDKNTSSDAEPTRRLGGGLEHVEDLAVGGRPAAPSGFSRKLLEHGIDTRPARNAALIALLEDIPPPILADTLGLHINTAVRWTDIARRDWTTYLAARDAEPRSAGGAKGVPCGQPGPAAAITQQGGP